MRSTLLGLSVPLLLLAATYAGVASFAAAESATYTVSGRVVSDEGLPLEGVRVNAYTHHEDAYRSSFGSEDRATTDADGRYTLQLAGGKGSINVHHEEWRQSDWREILVDGNLSDVDFTLKTPPPRTAIVTGIVLGPDGQPVEGAQVSLGYACCYAYASDGGSGSVEPAIASEGSAAAPDEPTADAKMVSPRPAIMPYYDDHQTQTTGADGRFTFQGYAGPRQVTAWAKGYAQTTTQVEARENETVEVDIRLEKVPPRDAVLAGRVVDATTGAPIEGAHVSARSLEWGRYAEARTGADGAYRLQTLPGWTEISINVWPYDGESKPLPAEADAELLRPVQLETRYFQFSTLIELESGDNKLEAKLAPKPKPTTALIGYVIDPTTDKAVPGANVHVWNHETGDWGEAVTDATGSFRILVRPGHYSASAWKEGHLGGSQTFVVDGDATERVDLLAPKGTSKWAPCYEESDCGPVMMETKAVAAPSAEPRPEPAPGPVSTVASADASSVSEGAARSGGSGAATFAGSGGGLPPYEPGAPQSGVTAAERAQADVPAAGALALVGVLAAAAIALRRRG